MRLAFHDLEEQEKRDTVPRGTYQKLNDMGVLDVADGLRVPEPAHLWEDIKSRWGLPAAVVCDRFRLPLLQDAVHGACYIEPRITRWSDAVFDVRALQKGFKDGPFSVEESSRPLLIASSGRGLRQERRPGEYSTGEAQQRPEGPR